MGFQSLFPSQRLHVVEGAVGLQEMQLGFVHWMHCLAALRLYPSLHPTQSTVVGEVKLQSEHPGLVGLHVPSD